ncbi:hypothetical protein AAHA92_17550 [Salvia divinorum]|uniref:Uncharacterized protein n=1 Tax=Salvia divinorum TaxID=28513 RepID=A0ABD1H349_SALDI
MICHKKFHPRPTPYQFSRRGTAEGERIPDCSFPTHTHTLKASVLFRITEVFALERAVIGVELPNLWNLSERG